MVNAVEIEEQIRKRLIDAVKQSGMTNTAIAKQAGLSISMFTDYKNKGKLPTLVNFAIICKILDVSSDDILGIKS